MFTKCAGMSVFVLSVCIISLDCAVIACQDTKYNVLCCSMVLNGLLCVAQVFHAVVCSEMCRLIETCCLSLLYI